MKANNTPKKEWKDYSKKEKVQGFVGLGIFATVGLVVFASCAGGSDEAVSAPAPATSSAAPVTPEAKPEPTLSKDDAFVAEVRSNRPVFNDYFTDDLLKMAENACLDLDNGRSVLQVAQDIEAIAANPEESEAFGYLFGASVREYCPEYIVDIEAALK